MPPPFRRARRLAFAVALGVGLGSLAAGAVDSVSVSRLSVGTVVDVGGSGFGTRPSAFLRNAATGKKKRVAIARSPAATDASFQFLAPKAVAGAYELDVFPRGVRTPFTFAGLTVETPQPASLQPRRGEPRSQVTISGAWFGTRKGAVILGAKRKAKVVSWTDAEIRFVVPRIAAGPVDVTVTNSAGASAPLVAGFTVTPPGSGSDVLDFTAGTLTGEIGDSASSFVSVEDTDLGATHRLVVRGQATTASPATSTAVVLDGFVAEGSTFPQTLSGSVVSISFTRSAGGSPVEDYAGTGATDLGDPSHDVQVVIESFDGTTATGSFSGTTKRGSVGTLGATLFVSGTFVASAD